MMRDEPIILSDEGKLRQRQILIAAQQAAKSRKHRRVALQIASSLVVLAAVGLLLVRSGQTRHSLPPIAKPIHVEPQQQLPAPIVIVQHIETDPDILRRLSLPPIASTVRHISEDELLRELADAHQAAGVISVDGKARLVFR